MGDDFGESSISKVFEYKHEALSLNPKASVEKPGIAAWTWKPSTEGAEEDGYPELAGKPTKS